MAWRVLLRYLDHHRARYLGGGTLLLATNLCALAIPWVIKDTIEAVSGPPTSASRGAVARGALLVIGLAVAQGVVRSASRLALLGAGQRVEARIRDDVFERLLALPQAFYQRQRTGDLMSRATNDLSSVTMLIGFGILSLVNTAVVYAGALVAMLRLDPWLTLAALAPYPILIGVATRFNTRAHVETLAVQEQLAHLSAQVQENLTGMAVVRAYTMETAEIEAFSRLNAEHLRRVVRQARTQGAFSPLMGIVGGLGALTVLWLGGRTVMMGRISLGAFVAFSSYLGYLAWPTMALGWVLAIVQRGLTAMQRIVEILETRPAIAVATPTESPTAVVGDIEFRRLSFSYGDGRAPALRDVSLRIPAGACVALVGPTGAGKTTLAALLPRLWEPPPGTLFIDDRDVQTIPLRDLRRAIGFVPQESFLFSRALSENVVLEGARDRLEWAARVASLSGDISGLPRGWDTVVGERGLTLSGGQRQRATLARALARDPRILILDDAFASVDAETEADILARLRETVHGRTTLIITHRLRVAQLADWIVVMGDGRLVGQGTHADLVGADGLYATLWRRQQLEAVLAEAR